MAESSSVPKKSAGFRIRFEPRVEEPPKWFPLVISIGALIVALILGGFVIIFAGGDPMRSYVHIAKASFGNIGVISDTIVKSTPIMLAALACSSLFE